MYVASWQQYHIDMALSQCSYRVKRFYNFTRTHRKAETLKRGEERREEEGKVGDDERRRERGMGREK